MSACPHETTRPPLDESAFQLKHVVVNIDKKNNSRTDFLITHFVEYATFIQIFQNTFRICQVHYGTIRLNIFWIFRKY